MPLELAGVPPQSLVPAALQGAASVDDFMARLPEFDADMQARVAEADAKVQSSSLTCLESLLAVSPSQQKRSQSGRCDSPVLACTDRSSTTQSSDQVSASGRV